MAAEAEAGQGSGTLNFFDSAAIAVSDSSDGDSSDCEETQSRKRRREDGAPRHDDQGADGADKKALPTVSQLFAEARHKRPDFLNCGPHYEASTVQSFDRRKTVQKAAPWLARKQRQEEEAKGRPNGGKRIQAAKAPTSSAALAAIEAAGMASHSYRKADEDGSFVPEVGARTPITDLNKRKKKEDKGKTFREKEKRKRDMGQASRGKSFVEEEKRLLREHGISGAGQGFD